MADETLPAVIPGTDIQSQAAKIGQEDADDLAVINYLTAVTQANQTTRLRKLEESKIPIGDFSQEYLIRDEVKTINASNPWISFHIVNYGPGSVRVKANQQQGSMSNAAPIAKGETYRYEGTYPSVDRIYLVSDSASAVKVFAIEGRRA